MRYKCTVAYDGFDYKGFQIQGKKKTIELALNEAISLMTKQRIKIVGSGRTDAQVHAKGQVFHFDADFIMNPDAMKTAMNWRLAKDIRIIEIEPVDETFHARFSAIKKEYHYLVSTVMPSPFESRYKAYYESLDIERIKDALNHFIGTHDFRGFCSATVHKEKDCTREIIKADLVIEEDCLRFIFIGTGFLKYQVRRMMGLILDIGSGKDEVTTIDKVLDSKDPKISHKVAPGYGLYLEHVYY